jgi:mono/diheme cytochrome c family protein
MILLLFHALAPGAGTLLKLSRAGNRKTMNMKLLSITAVLLFGGAAAWLTLPSPARAQGRQASVLDGVYSEAQATRGKEQYGEKCSECHEGAEPNGPELMGSTFVDNWREDTLDGLYTFIKTRMPQDAQGSLSDAQYIDILAYLLQLNNYKTGAKDLTAEATKNILMVGENGPQPLPANSSVRVTGCFSGAGDAWKLTKAADPNRARETDSVTDADLKASEGKSGTHAYQLRNLDSVEGLKPAAAAGHNAVVKGVLDKDRINVLSMKALPATCTP